MKVLAIESSSRTAGVALVDDNGIIGEYSINYLKHSVILMPMIDELLKRCGVSIGDITHIAVSEGPGSFTGLRIGAATAKGLAHA
ncbi:MAG: Glycoprotease family, partial [Caldanaerobacter subterraneus]